MSKVNVPLTDEQEAMLLDMYDATKTQGEQRLVLDEAKDDDGVSSYVIRDELAEAGKRVLWKRPKGDAPGSRDADAEYATRADAERVLIKLRRLRIIKVILAVGMEMERQDGAFRSAN